MIAGFHLKTSKDMAWRWKVARCGSAVVVASLIGAPALAGANPKPGELRLKSCEREGITAPAKCGTFTVWENRDEKSGRTINLNVVVLEATGSDPRPDPYVFLTGGPGEAATSAAPELNDDDVREQRDILLVDQRGTGQSNGLHCRREKTGPLQAFMATIDAELVRECRRELEKRADLRYYLTTHAMDDLDGLRAALGYEQINLVGGSYGTRAALVYIRRHGRHVRSAILMASTALGHPMPARFATDAEESLRNVLRDCAAETSWTEAFPALDHDYRRAVRNIEESPRTIRVHDPRTGDSVEVVFRASDFAESLRAMLYGPKSTRRIPLLLHHAASTGDYRPFAEYQLKRNLVLNQAVAMGMYFALTCTEDVARVDAEAVYAAGRGTFMADHRARPHIEGCEGWPLGRLPAAYGEEVESEVPVLTVTGANDPTTPPASAHAAASRLANARVVIVPDGGHDLVGLVGRKCVEGIVARFLATTDSGALDTTCVADVHRPPFILSLDEAD